MVPKAETCDPENHTPETLSLKASKTEILGDTIMSAVKQRFLAFRIQRNFFFCFGVCLSPNTKKNIETYKNTFEKTKMIIKF